MAPRPHRVPFHRPFDRDRSDVTRPTPPEGRPETIPAAAAGRGRDVAGPNSRGAAADPSDTASLQRATDRLRTAVAADFPPETSRFLDRLGRLNAADWLAASRTAVRLHATPAARLARRRLRQVIAQQTREDPAGFVPLRRLVGMLAAGVLPDLIARHPDAYDQDLQGVVQAAQAAVHALAVGDALAPEDRAILTAPFAAAIPPERLFGR